ncbi:transposase : Endonuclease DDE OS=Burkholderia zhejiangensis GN=BG60_33605 PE=4 SV=1: HTH_29: DDE_3 [Gemmataceae bacterium]|nr:transposase : Endonuclease DDE OS=Burkholderia zhejiangensis GN=BG60_33605 PE=4 SV=1: HTH_29: DDE_3 [Gemmataceae bacterium]VTT98802.1 transposase : Endonuclease DDE OS=Burkholderia zhejiangensis GN=BG60_33605 PE=4 SV=1: HTH_29: DDE_3 [Gemmataceae bacterium]
MPRGPKPTPITLTEDERTKLTDWARRPTSAQRLALRARIVLAAADGHANATIATDLRITAPTARKWRDRFSARRLEGLVDEPRPGAPRTVTDEQVESAVTRTPESKPANATHWSTRTLARELGLSQTAVVRIWHAFGLKPHRRSSFKFSTDPLFVEKVRDIVGLYLSPPERAVVLGVDEKSQIQALDRTQPIQPLLPGRSEKASHDYVRHGTTSLFAALDVATGKVIGACRQRHRHQEFLAFLDHLAEAMTRTPGTTIHVVMDNYGTHKHPRVRDWFVRHPEFVPHFTPTSGSWLNQVERFFAQITERRIRRDAFRSVTELEHAIAEYLRAHNKQPRPFVWTKSADVILNKVRKLAERLAPDQPVTNF